MAKLTVEDLSRIKERVTKEETLGEGGHAVKITVHLGTCGIAAGGDQVMEALKEEVAKSGRKDIKIVISGCMGMCSSEPNITVRRLGEEGVLYYNLDAEKARQVFEGHVLGGKVQTDFALAKIT
ncbi:MAG: (2Fe-2S) ferredoxin domain-containing protein [Deltaproteobacteria bacterium]|nr:(2Fe-2S) ferredoxin domain-containing protein [Deltaproteobacteria bacterium]